VNTNELCEYYADLLIMQFRSKPNAYGEIRAMAATMNMLQDTTEVVTISPLPVSGQLVLGYAGELSAAINWDDTDAEIQAALRTIEGLEEITVTGDVVSGSFTVTFTGVVPPAAILYVDSCTLEDADEELLFPTIEQTDVILPVAIRDGYGISQAPYAKGVQLDVLAKYAGVGRNAVGIRGPVVLNDASLLRLIQIATLRNRLTSGMGAVADFLNVAFPSQVVVTDNFDMTMLLEVSTVLRESALWQAFLYYNLVPRPMGVGVLFDDLAPVFGEFFGFRTYEDPNPNVFPMNYYGMWNYAGNFFTYEDGE
jgi:hypothetical protein